MATGSGITEIANIALTNLGEATITDVQTDNNERARLLNNRFDDIRDSVLRSHPWNVTVRRSVLSAYTSTPAWGYKYAFTFPTDTTKDPAEKCLRILSLQDHTTPYRIEGNEILTDASTLNVKWQARVTDLTTLDPILRNVMGLRIAWELAEPLTGKTALKDEMFRKYSASLQEARSLDAQEGGSVERIEINTWLDSRLGDYRTDYRPVDWPSDGTAYGTTYSWGKA